MKMQIIIAVVAFVVTAGSSIGVQMFFAPDPPPMIVPEEGAEEGHGKGHDDSHGADHGESHDDGHGHDDPGDSEHGDSHEISHGDGHDDGHSDGHGAKPGHGESHDDSHGEGGNAGDGALDHGHQDPNAASSHDDGHEKDPKASHSSDGPKGDPASKKADSKKSGELPQPTGHISPRREVEEKPDKYGEGIAMPESPVLVFNEMGGVLGSMSPDDAAAFINAVTDERAIAMLRAMRLREARKILMALPRKRAQVLREKMLDITKEP
ncbi:MAG: hypothetical protein HKN21_04815 [Candidatus Eisenbacteria bacterium]|uniref:Magnesium transporter MgtE intracellular domain-containing protein n=1 Tax=Eiseniibacteriota bacterium TaxID=2212470 RepID=A0A7Y2E9V4_UNCEI|nr:hypothetical protein [Candidatus Eisenbacteria bacterium]